MDCLRRTLAISWTNGSSRCRAFYLYKFLDEFGAHGFLMKAENQTMLETPTKFAPTLAASVDFYVPSAIT